MRRKSDMTTFNQPSQPNLYKSTTAPPTFTYSANPKPQLYRQHSSAIDYQMLHKNIQGIISRYTSEHTGLVNVLEGLHNNMRSAFKQNTVGEKNVALLQLVKFVAQHINGNLASYAPLTCCYRDVKRAISAAFSANPMTRNIATRVEKIWKDITYKPSDNEEDNMDSTIEANSLSTSRDFLMSSL